MGLTSAQIGRYSRQIVLPDVGSKGQEKLLSAKVLIVGCGGLGSSCALYLAAAGIGRIGIVDSDAIELHNLQRQILHSAKDVGRPKAESANDRLSALNPEIEIIPYKLRLTQENALEVIKEYDIIVDGSDNLATKYLINDACVISRKPFSCGSVFRYYGQAITVLPDKSACYRCLFRRPPPPEFIADCRQTGILGTVPGVIGTIQANEVLKYILGIGVLLAGKLLVFDALNSSFHQVKVTRDPACAICAKSRDTLAAKAKGVPKWGHPPDWI